MSKMLYTQMTVVIISALLALAIGVSTSDADRWAPAQAQSTTQRSSSVRPDDRAGIRNGSVTSPITYPDVFERAVAAHLASTRQAADSSRGGFPWTTAGLGVAILALAAAILVRSLPAARRMRERAA